MLARFFVTIMLKHTLHHVIERLGMHHIIEVISHLDRTVLAQKARVSRILCPRHTCTGVVCEPIQTPHHGTFWQARRHLRLYTLHV